MKGERKGKYVLQEWDMFFNKRGGIPAFDTYWTHSIPGMSVMRTVWLGPPLGMRDKNRTRSRETSWLYFQITRRTMKVTTYADTAWAQHLGRYLILEMDNLSKADISLSWYPIGCNDKKMRGYLEIPKGGLVTLNLCHLASTYVCFTVRKDCIWSQRGKRGTRRRWWLHIFVKPQISVTKLFGTQCALD